MYTPLHDSGEQEEEDDDVDIALQETPCVSTPSDCPVRSSTPEPYRHLGSSAMATSHDAPSKVSLPHSDRGDGGALSTEIPKGGREKRPKLNLKVQTPSSAGLMDAVIQWFRNYYDSLFRITFILLLLLIERVVQDNFFVCPCKSTKLNRFYSTAFLLVPTLVLFGAAILLNNVTWRAVTGCIARRKYGRYGCLNWGRVLCRLMPGALTAPFVWVVFAFLDGRFYACMFKGGDTCSPSSLELHEMAMEVEVLHTDSQLIGYGLLCLGLIICFLYMCICQMMNPLPYEHQKYLNVYEDEFSIQKDVLIREFARDTLRKDIKCFIDDVLIEEWGEAGEEDHKERSRASTLEGLARLGSRLDEDHDKAVRSFSERREDTNLNRDSFAESQTMSDQDTGRDTPEYGGKSKAGGRGGCSSNREGDTKQKRDLYRPYWREGSHEEWERITRPIFVEKPSASEGAEVSSPTGKKKPVEKKGKRQWKRKRNQKDGQIDDGDDDPDSTRRDSVV